MDAKDALRDMVESSGLTQAQIEARANKYSGWVGQSLARPRPGADLIALIARACGYRLALVPDDGGRAITIGDDAADLETSDPIGEARALIARASSILEAMEGGEAASE
jgi:hypothetical protein